MQRSNAVIERVSVPSRGLITRIPPNVTSPDKRGIVAGENVRAERGVLSAAPGYERVIPSPQNLDSPANLIFQSNILNQDPETRSMPYIGTTERLYTVLRRSKALVCDVNNGGGGSCTARVGFLGDSGRVGANLANVASLIKSWVPDFIVHTGDIVYADGVVDPMASDYEECVGQYFGADYVGGYNGLYGVGPSQNKFFPTLGNHDWDDGGIFNYLEFFSFAKNPNERYYHFKRGPLHFVILDSGGFSPGSVDPDGYGIGSDQAVWLESVLAASDCPFLFVVVHFPAWTSDSNYYPGNTDTQSLAPLCAKYNVTAIISGHAHNSEVLMVPNVSYSGGTRDVWQLVSGAGGHSLRSFNNPLSPFSIWGNDSQYAALRLDADRQTATFQFIAVDGTILRTQTFSNPRESSGICYIGDAAKKVFTLEVRPSEASVEVGQSWPYRAFANYQDGTVEDVTEECVWESSNDTIGAVGPTTGIAVGNSPGIVTITATYVDQSDAATFKVLHSCIDEPTEVIFCISRSSSMGGFSGGSTRLEAAKEAVEATIDAFDPEIDKMGLVSFAGMYIPQTEDATLDSVLTDDFDSVKDAVSLLVPDGAVGIPSGLDTAYAELTSSRHTAGHLRAVVLVVDWPANVTNPDGTSTSQVAAIAAAMAAAQASATAIKGLEDTTLIVFGYNVPSAYRTGISNLATLGYYFDCTTADELKSDMSSLPHILCFYNGDKYYYQDEPHCGDPVADYQTLFDWDIVRGTVDLAGIGPGGETDSVAWNPRPGNGMYLDLIGTNVDNSPDFTTTAAKIQTKEEYPIVAGKTYELAFDMCSYTSLVAWTDAIVKSDDGTVFGTLRVTPPANGPFVTYTLSFVAASSGDARIIFDHQSHFPDPAGSLTLGKQGNLLDNVRFTNITDAFEMLFNDFDTENPCEL